MNPFTNPLVTRVCEVLDLDEIPDILMLEYSDGICYAKFYELGKSNNMNPPYRTERVNLDAVCKMLIEFLRSGDTAYPDVVGSDRKSIYDSITHRKVIDMRIVFPVCLLQVDYEDESTSIAFSDVAEDSIREKFRVQEAEEID